MYRRASVATATAATAATAAASAARPDRGRRWFAAWMLVGAGAAFALLGALTIGPLLLPLVALGVIGLTRRADAAGGAVGAVAGFGLGPLFVAYLNRDGPGDVCTTTARSVACVGEWSPWPWAAVGLALLVTGIVLVARRCS